MNSTQRSKVTDIHALANRLGQALDQRDGELFGDTANEITGLIRELGTDLDEALETVPVLVAAGPVEIRPRWTFHGGEYDPT